MFPPGARSILSPEILDSVRAVLDEGDGPIIVERAINRGGGGREWRMFEDFEEFRRYIQSCKSADLIYVWTASKSLKTEDLLIWGKCPNADGTVPVGGSY